MARTASLLLLACLVHCSMQRSTPADDHYVAAVVEYHVNRDVQHNVAAYTQLIQQAAQQEADIVVFPELTLTNGSTSFTVPLHTLLREHPVPALAPHLYDHLLVAMSEAARANAVYLVFNGNERVDCTRDDTGEECPERKEYLFNTNVVMDRAGAVIDRYRKINLFGEYSRTPALRPELGVFETDFGVTFGHFVCFDLMFQVPAVQVVQQRRLTDVVFTTMWFSEMPYLTAVQIQEAYALALDVNLLAAGANNPAVGSAGSGIFSGGAGALVSVMPGVPTTRLLVAAVPKVPGNVRGPVQGPIYDPPATQDGLVLITDPSLAAHVSRPLPAGRSDFVLVDRDVRCHFTATLAPAHQDQRGRVVYRAAARDGTARWARRGGGVAACGVLACADHSLASCVYRFDASTTRGGVEELQIEMRSYKHHHNATLQCDDVVYFPVSLRASKFPLARENFTYSEKFIRNIQRNEIDSQNVEKKSESDPSCERKSQINMTGHQLITFKINKPQDDLLSFGIFGRIYPRDVSYGGNVTQKDVDGFENILDMIYGND